MIKIKDSVDVLQLLKNRGYSTYRLRQEKILSENVISAIRHKERVSMDRLDQLCKLLNCQPADLIEYVPEW